MEISLEHKAGHVRRGATREGKKWHKMMLYDYGYFKRTKAPDGDHLDVYIGPHKNSQQVFVIHQNKSDGKTYDEDKVMVGFNTLEQAKRAFHIQVKEMKGDRFGGATHYSMSDFKKVLKSTWEHPRKLDMAAGGPGSGCNPEVGDCGRPAGSGHGEVPTTAVPQEVNDYIDSYRPAYNRAKEIFRRVVGEYGPMESRIKQPFSLYAKALKKNVPIQSITDVVGLRVTTRDLADVYKAAAELQRVFCKEGIPCKLDDKVSTPKEGYRGFHLDVTINGKPIEIQVRTENQSRWAIWAHSTLYKGAHGSDPQIKSYALKVSDALLKIDKRQRADLPDCPEYVQRKIGCFSFDLPATQGVLASRRLS